MKKGHTIRRRSTASPSPAAPSPAMLTPSSTVHIPNSVMSFAAPKIERRTPLQHRILCRKKKKNARTGQPKSRHSVASRDRRGFAAGMPPSPQPNAPEGVRTRPLTDSSSQLAERPIAARIAALGDPLPSRPTARAQLRRHSHTDHGREHSELTRRPDNSTRKGGNEPHEDSGSITSAGRVRDRRGSCRNPRG